MSQIIAKFKDGGYSLIVFDPIYKGLGDRDENKAGDIASLLNEIESLAVETGAAVAFGHHFSKGNQANKDSIDRIGGSGVFARALAGADRRSACQCDRAGVEVAAQSKGPRRSSGSFIGGEQHASD